MVGQTISHYKILEKLGGGSMGVVYKALDTKLDRFVALKFLPQHFSEDEAEKQRFIHEAKAASALDHPNICNIHEINETKDGQLFIAMAFYDGKTLQQKVKSGQLVVAEAVEIAVQISQGLAKAHEHGITHRDLKPANVMITKEGVAKIVDFGLAKFAGLSKLTKTGTTLGTVAYMSPEQARGEEVDHRTDVWALGVVLYEMITGQLPFKGEYEHAVMYSILNDEPKPMTELRSGVPMALEQIADKALTKSSEKRYQCMDEMLAALRTLKKEIESGNVKERPILAKLRRRKRSFLYAGLLVLFIGVGLYLKQSLKQEAKINSIAVLPLANLSGDANQEFFADGMTEDLISVLGQIQALRVISRTSMMQYKGGTKPLPVIGRELNVDAVVEGSVVSSGDHVNISVRLIEARTEKRLWSKNYDHELRDVLNLEKEVALAIADEIEVRVTGQEQAHLQEARAVNPEAYKLYFWGRHFQDQGTTEGDKQAAQQLEQAIAIDPNFAQAYAALPVTYWVMGLFRSMPKEEAKIKARQAAAKALELDENLPEAHIAMGLLREIYDWDWSGAEEELRHAIKLNPNSGAAHQEYGLCLSRQGKTKEGLDEMKRALVLDPVSQGMNANVVWAYTRNRQYDEAIAHSRKILQLNPSFSLVQFQLGLTYLTKGSYDEAITVFEANLDAMVSIAGLETLGHLGSAYALSGKREKALKLLNDLQDRFERGEGSTMSLAIIYLGLGEKDKAVAMLERDAEDRESNLFHFIRDPFFDPVRAEPRYQALLKKMGLAK